MRWKYKWRYEDVLSGQRFDCGQPARVHDEILIVWSAALAGVPEPNWAYWVVFKQERHEHPITAVKLQKLSTNRFLDKPEQMIEISSRIIATWNNWISKKSVLKTWEAQVCKRSNSLFGSLMTLQIANTWCERESTWWPAQHGPGCLVHFLSPSNRLFLWFC